MKALSTLAIILGTTCLCVEGDSYTAMAIFTAGLALAAAGIYGLYKNDNK